MKSTFALSEAWRAAHLMMTEPRAGRQRLERGVGVVRAAWLLRRCDCGELVNASGHVRVIADGRVRLGERVQLGGGMIPSEIVCRPGAELSIGARTFVNYGVSLRAARRIVIGERCLFGSMSRVRDHDHDGVREVIIGDDVWVAHGALVEPGVTIGTGSVVSAGSVVKTDVPPHSLAVGNPATFVPLVTRSTCSVAAGVGPST